VLLEKFPDLLERLGLVLALLLERFGELVVLFMELGYVFFAGFLAPCPPSSPSSLPPLVGRHHQRI